jgi:hypothetical protein
MPRTSPPRPNSRQPRNCDRATRAAALRRAPSARSRSGTREKQGRAYSKNGAHGQPFRPRVAPPRSILWPALSSGLPMPGASVMQHRVGFHVFCRPGAPARVVSRCLPPASVFPPCGDHAAQRTLRPCQSILWPRLSSSRDHQMQMSATNEFMAITSYLLSLAVAAIPLALAGALIGRPPIGPRLRRCGAMLSPQ